MPFDPRESPQSFFPRGCGGTGNQQNNLRLAHGSTLIQRMTPNAINRICLGGFETAMRQELRDAKQGGREESTEPWGKWRGETEQWGWKERMVQVVAGGREREREMEERG